MSTNREFTKLCLEKLEDRKVFSASWFGNAVMPRISNVLSRSAETRVPQTIKVQIISDAKAFETTWLNRVDNRVVGVLTADIRPMTNRTNNLSVKIDYSGSFDGDSGLDDLARIGISRSVITVTSSFTAEKTSSGKWRPKGLVFRTEASCDVELKSGAAKGATWRVQMLTTDARGYSPKFQGISEAELVAAAIRNVSNCLPSTALDMAQPAEKLLSRASKLAGPFGGALSKISSQIRLVSDFGSTASGGRPDEAILADVKANKLFTVHCGNNEQLNRFCSGAVTSILSYRVDSKLKIEKIPILDTPLGGVSYFGLVSASASLRGSLEAKAFANIICIADSRGYGLAAGTKIGLEVTANAGLAGSISILGYDRWSVLSGDVEAGVFLKGKLAFQIGDEADSGKNGSTFYFESILNKKGALSDYVGSVISATGGAYLNKAVRVLGVTIWESSKTWDTELYKAELFSATRKL